MAQIIPKNHVQVEPEWQKELAQVFTDLHQLLAHLEIDDDRLAQHAKARRLFPMRVPRPFAQKMQKGNINDPLLRQVMPLSDEFEIQDGFSADPLQEHDTASKGLLHKYQSRVLLIVRGGCAVNCRYCFRRHFPYQDNALRRADWAPTLDYIREHTELDEVILSGGDPLMAKDEFLGWLGAQIAEIDHIRRLRIHTRLPVVIPQRVNSDFIHWFSHLPLQKVMVLHINHANEIDDALKKRCQQMREAGITLLNQAVLLRGVNDTLDAQVELNETLFECGVLPYYLHLLDKVQGAGHFLVQDDDARQLMKQVIKRLPGFLVPKLVREIGGQPGKTPVDLRIIDT
ncbi:EF-P beta-lysylation protein EpmB [Alteromonas sediminis]|uniref:L-lysine 2,3-aminomutase n=1 Tax=Alteromonas sediminis TaxID=2259342 RepID=A0A3N5YAV8_9ALTE|nr:EF-P beta-lysylation protein EpmB [Alteromonas sediminis]RPJ66005.1 EF-P beta-lysylation protein EpmB [Alteromonas sediminis]